MAFQRGYIVHPISVGVEQITVDQRSGFGREIKSEDGIRMIGWTFELFQVEDRSSKTIQVVIVPKLRKI